ncbi:MAG: RNA polymerase sigma factor [Planctomycetota bacterium JB042]
MSTRLAERSNDAWIAALRGRGDADDAVGELSAYLHRVLGRALAGRLPAGLDLPELVQESLARIVASLPSFRGDSAFSTWAAGVALRVGFTALRRRSVRDRATDPFGAVERELSDLPAPASDRPDAVAARNDLHAALSRAIATRLTERQRLAVVAELRGVPTVEIADRLGTNPNALYKLTHDARVRLRRALLDAGFGADAIRAAAKESPPCR